tara:strand:- start:1597 stop:1920 length:324 start_codon:yes stop_codon:yes gene_type:complete
MLNRAYLDHNPFCDDRCDKDYEHDPVQCDYKYDRAIAADTNTTIEGLGQIVANVDDKFDRIANLLEWVVERLYDSSYNPSDRVYTPRYKAPTPEPAPTQATIQRRGL